MLSADIVDQVLRTGISERRDGQRGARIVQPDAPDFHAHLPGVTPAHDGEIVQVVERGADLQVRELAVRSVKLSPVLTAPVVPVR